VKCSVCGETVTKRSTLNVGDGERACRSHGEAVEASNKVQAKAEAEKLIQQRKHEEFYGPRSKDFEVLDPTERRCWVCGREGVHQQDFHLRILRCMDQWQSDHDKTPNFFDDKEMDKVLKPMSGTVCLWVVPYGSAETIQRYRKLLRHHLREVANIAQAFMVCPFCVKEHGITLPQVKFTGVKAATLLAPILDDVVIPKVCVEPRKGV
jgi:hypothetical protein